MRRWNDKICPVELRELDKQSHKMIIAFLLGKSENEVSLNWKDIIEGGIFEFLYRLIVTDLKPQIFYKIRQDKNKFKQLNRWVYRQLEPIISPVDQDFFQRFKKYFTQEQETLNKRILAAAHFYATKWEFNIIQRANPNGYEIEDIRDDLQVRQEKYYDLKGIQSLALYQNLRNFIDLCGELRFQSRWSHIVQRVPKTSVLGHMFLVAILSYLFSLELNACQQRCYNNFFGGLFHDLPEVLTRDIIDPIKRSIPGFDSIIKIYEKEQMEKHVYNLIPDWQSEMRMFTEREFYNYVSINGREVSKKSSDMKKFNKDRYNPIDGEIIKASDDLTAFIEAHLAIENGITATELQNAKLSIRKEYANKSIADINFGVIYADFQ